MIGKVFENVVADPADYEMLAAAVLTAFSENLGSHPREEQGAHDDHQINGDHSIKSDSKHVSYVLSDVP